MKNVTVLGYGRVGHVIAEDLINSGFSVTVADSRLLKYLLPGATAVQADLSTREGIDNALFSTNPDIVVNAVPGHLGYEVLDAVTSAGGTLVDISFMEQSPLDCTTKALENEAIAVVDCGICPGLNGIMLGYENERMSIGKFVTYSGGIPKFPVRPWMYKAQFSPIDVVEEYTRPVRVMEDGEVVFKDAISDKNLVNVCGLTLEAANTDGLRTIIDNMPYINDMKEQTLRYPGHYDIIQTLKDARLLDGPAREHMEKALIEVWYSVGEPDIMIQRALIEGTLSGVPTTVTYDLYDEHDGTRSAMSRCTGYVATGAVRAIAEGLITRCGVLCPEHIGAIDGVYDFMVEHLKDRGVEISKSVVQDRTFEGVWA